MLTPKKWLIDGQSTRQGRGFEVRFSGKYFNTWVRDDATGVRLQKALSPAGRQACINCRKTASNPLAAGQGIDQIAFSGGAGGEQQQENR